jgi:hypothetical protein
MCGPFFVWSNERMGMAMKRALAMVLFGLAGSSWAAPGFVMSPYTYIPASVTPAPAPLPLTWAFASGECGEEMWGARTGQAVAEANVPRFVQAGTSYIISTGGQGNVFTCGSNAGMERFVARYLSPQLIGLDFDIEAGQSVAQIASLAQRVAWIQKKHPKLRMSFTIATHAASDGSKRSLNATGETVLAALRRHGVRDYVLNLMVMDYGPAERKVCVVGSTGRCDMGASGVQAARNVHAKYGVPLRQIELTAMIGVNDVVENVFTPADAALLAGAARKMGLAGLHFWSLERDRPCDHPVQGADPACSGLPDVPQGAFARALAGEAP